MKDVPSLCSLLYCIIKMMRCVSTVEMQHPMIWHHRLRLAEIPVMCLTACVIGVRLAGIAKCRSISSKFPIKERLPGPCSQIASGCSMDRQTGEHFAHSSFPMLRPVHSFRSVQQAINLPYCRTYNKEHAASFKTGKKFWSSDNIINDGTSIYGSHCAYMYVWFSRIT